MSSCSSMAQRKKKRHHSVSTSYFGKKVILCLRAFCGQKIVQNGDCFALFIFCRELHDMERAKILMKKTKFKATELFQPCYLKPLSISIGLMFFQQFSGINAVMFYSVSIFKLSGSSIDSNIATIILGIVNIGATIFSNAVIDRFEILFLSNTFGSTQE